jgi:hypothetical protein
MFLPQGRIKLAESVIGMHHGFAGGMAYGDFARLPDWLAFVKIDENSPVG